MCGLQKGRIGRSVSQVSELLKASFSQWTVHDDHLLIESMQHCPDGKRIAQDLKFSIPFTHQEIMERWTAILTDHEVSRFSFALFLFLYSFFFRF